MLVTNTCPSWSYVLTLQIRDKSQHSHNVQGLTSQSVPWYPVREGEWVTSPVVMGGYSFRLGSERLSNRERRDQSC